MNCGACGKEIADDAVICVGCGRAVVPFVVEDGSAISEFAGKKIAAGVCGILLGSLGAHKFVLGLTGPGLIMLLSTLLTLGFGSLIMGPIGLIEGIIYLTKSDREFYDQYAVKKRGWF